MGTLMAAGPGPNLSASARLKRSAPAVWGKSASRKAVEIAPSASASSRVDGDTLSDFGRTLGRIIAPLGANIDRRPALGSGEDIRELQAGGVPVASLHQDGLDYFDIHHTADDTLDKIDPKQLDQAVAIWSAFTYLAAASDVDFRSLAATAK